MKLHARFLVRDLKFTVRSCGLVEVYHAPQYTEIGTTFLTIDCARSNYTSC